MKFIFIYRQTLNFKRIEIYKEEFLYEIIKETPDEYKVKIIKGNYDTNYFKKNDLSYFLANKNHFEIQDFEEEKIITGGFIYDDEENYHEEHKILLKIKISETMKIEIDNIIDKFNQIKKEL